MKNKAQAGTMIALFAPLVIGVILLSIVFTFQSDVTSQTAITEDQFTGVNGTCTRITTDCYIAGTFSSINQSGETTTGNYTECGSDGKLYGVSVASDASTGVVSATQNASYTQLSCGYINNSMTRTMLGYFPLLMGVVLISLVGAVITFKR